MIEHVHRTRRLKHVAREVEMKREKKTDQSNIEKGKKENRLLVSMR